MSLSATPESQDAGYVLDEQVGFILRQVHQRHALIFAARFGDDLTPTQWATVAKLSEVGPCSQNLLGRLTAMDVSTIKGVVERLARRGYAETAADPTDRRRLVVALTGAGKDAYGRFVGLAAEVTEETLAPLNPKERATLIRLLQQLR